MTLGTIHLQSVITTSMEVFTWRAFMEQFEVIEQLFDESRIAKVGWWDDYYWSGPQEASFYSWFIKNHPSKVPHEVRHDLRAWVAAYGWKKLSA